MDDCTNDEWKDFWGGGGFIAQVGSGARAVAEDAIAYIHSLYAAGIRYTDDRTGEGLTLLGSRGLLENSLLVLISDYGEEFMKHEKLLYTQFYEETMRTPFAPHSPNPSSFPLVRQPKHVTCLDVAPTVLSYLDIATPKGMEGCDLCLCSATSTPCWWHRRL
ncbi:MAG: sulfatase-like hydrolase/transferase [bacterium]|nr:sulfatase-like hydrolase/transferase [bacterium]